MFSRNFMKQFPIRKYADISARSGSSNTDMWLVSPVEVRLARFIKIIGFTAFFTLVLYNFHSMDEIIGTAARPLAATVYERSVPKEVLYPNYPIIQGFEAIDKMKELQASLEYDK